MNVDNIKIAPFNSMEHLQKEAQEHPEFLEHLRDIEDITTAFNVMYEKGGYKINVYEQYSNFLKKRNEELQKEIDSNNDLIEFMENGGM